MRGDCLQSYAGLYRIASHRKVRWWKIYDVLNFRVTVCADGTTRHHGPDATDQLPTQNADDRADGAVQRATPAGSPAHDDRPKLRYEWLDRNEPQYFPQIRPATPALTIPLRRRHAIGGEVHRAGGGEDFRLLRGGSCCLAFCACVRGEDGAADQLCDLRDDGVSENSVQFTGSSPFPPHAGGAGMRRGRRNDPSLMNHNDVRSMWGGCGRYRTERG
jgi:hypothetical protein